MTFAKIVKADDGHDVLFYKRSDDESAPVIAIVMEHEGTAACMELGYDNDDAGWNTRDEEFEKMGLEKANGFRSALMKMIGGGSD